MTLDDLPGHEGLVGVRLADGSLRPEADAGAAVGYRAMCSCGWIGAADYGPTDEGRMSATSDWTRHMGPLWAAAPPRWLLNRADSLRVSLSELVPQWPLQALGVLAEVDRWQRSLVEEAVAAARANGASWADIGAALGITKQSAHERFSRRPPPEAPPAS
ncbi:hypothetical protein WEI85_23835 [Actinomycetes bacterium KLBMP 9797]